MTPPSYVLLCGGVGGSRLAHGLARVLPPGHLTIVVNNGTTSHISGYESAPTSIP